MYLHSHYSNQIYIYNSLCRKRPVFAENVQKPKFNSRKLFSIGSIHLVQTYSALPYPLGTIFLCIPNPPYQQIFNKIPKTLPLFIFKADMYIRRLYTCPESLDVFMFLPFLFTRLYFPWICLRSSIN